MTQKPPIIFVPASRLTVAPTNVRKRCDPVADEELKTSILAKGVIQNLVGLAIPRKKGEYRIIAGGRRLKQVQALIEEGKLDAARRRSAGLAGLGCPGQLDPRPHHLS